MNIYCVTLDCSYREDEQPRERQVLVEAESIHDAPAVATAVAERNWAYDSVAYRMAYRITLPSELHMEGD